MIYKRKNLITTNTELHNLVNEKKFITYANVNSFRVNPESIVEFYFVADGWPVALYSSILLRKRVPLLSFFRCRQDWVAHAKEKKVALIGHDENEIHRVNEAAKKIGVNFKFAQHGYLTDDELVELIEREYDKVDIIFLGIAQPRQEIILDRIKGLEGKTAVVCCGAFWLQELKLTKAVSKTVTMLGLVPLTRFYHSPFELFKRTILSIPYVFRNLK